MKKLVTQVELVDYYLSKIEQYLGRKHQSILSKSSASVLGDDSIYSGSPKSTLSDRVNTYEDDDHRRMDDDIPTAMGGFEN